MSNDPEGGGASDMMESGVEISLSPRSNAALDSRLCKDSESARVAIHEDEHASTGTRAKGSNASSGANNNNNSFNDDWGQPVKEQDLYQLHGGTPPRRKQTVAKSRRFKQLVLLLIMVAIGGMVAGGLMAWHGKRDKEAEAQLSAINSNSNSAEQENAAAPDGASPSVSPTAIAENADRTASPTATLPTTIRSVQSQYAYGAPVAVFFAFGNDQTAQAQADDWIGIYPAEDPRFSESEAFLFLCNQLTLCDAPVSVGQVTFGTDDHFATDMNARLSTWTWPLEPGDYKAYVLRGFRAPFQVLAETAVSFEVKRDFMAHAVVPAVQQVEDDIRALIAQDETMGAKFVRLGFHDCTGGCDGCVDMTFADNAGLEVPIEALAPIVERHESAEFGISRADIWAISALVGADVAQARSATKVDFSLQYLGRQNCEDRFAQCFDKDGIERECSATLGPHVHLPEADITTDELFHFFSDEFDMGVQETVALMGAHTLGQLSRTNSGYDGPNGWVRDNLLLDNDYFIELVGGEDADASLDDLINLAPPWLRFEIDNEDLEGIPDRPAWRAFPPSFSGQGTEEILMLNADLAIVRELTEENIQIPGGRVFCAFTRSLAEESGSTACPHASRSLQFAADYKFDNDLWLRDFEAVYKKMLNHGYEWDPDRRCLGGLCLFGPEER